MIQVLVKLHVKNFSVFEEFERAAIATMKIHQGRIVSAFETARKLDGTGVEFHLLEFPSEEAFADYRADTSLAQLSELRSAAISETEVIVSTTLKSYD